jgi:hypothetical protein
MNLSKWTIGLGVLGLGMYLTLSPVPQIKADAEEGNDAGQEAGVEAQGRGPVHEAFADPGAAARPTPIVAKQPPDAIDEVPPDQKPDGDNIQWIPGYWAYDEDAGDYMWVSGCWRAAPPGKQWMPGHWAEVDGGFQWTPGFWSDAQAEEAEVAPPPPQNIDAGPSTPAPGVDSVYVSGTWVYRTRRFFWRPGFWYTPRAGWIWVPARYSWTPAGYVFIDGYWDYPLESRGLLFAPVVIEPRLWGRPRWVYRPRIVLYTPALMVSLFVRPDYGCYYFGDFYESRYRERFVPWIDFRVTRYRGSYDPLFSYCRWEHRNNRSWERNLRTLYVNRVEGRAPRPPVTLVQQTTVVKNITNVTNIRNVTMMAPLTKVDKTVVKLQPVSQTQLALQTKAARQIRTLSLERQKITATAVAKGPAPVKPTDVPKVTRLTLPKTTTAITPKTVVKPPAPPVAPKHVERTLPKHEPVKPVVIPHPKPKTETKPEPKPKPKVEVKPEPKPKPKVEVKPEPKPKPKTDVKPEPKPVIKKPEPKPVAKPEPKPMPKKPDPKPAAKPEPKKNFPTTTKGEKHAAHGSDATVAPKSTGSHPARK